MFGAVENAIRVIVFTHDTRFLIFCFFRLKVFKFIFRNNNKAKRSPVNDNTTPQDEVDLNDVSTNENVVKDIASNVAEPFGNSATESLSEDVQRNTPKETSTHLTQTRLTGRFLKMTKIQSDRITMAIAYLIAVSCLAYSIVENIGFRYLLNVLAPNYTVPSRKTFSDDRVPRLYAAVKKRIEQDLKKIQFFGMTTDGWTASNSNKFIGVTVSYIDDNWKLICRTLACRDLNISNSGKNIQALINKTQITAATSDRGPNAVHAIDLSGFDHVPCFAHAVNTKMEEMLANNFIAPTLSKIKAIYNTMSNSKNAKNYLASCQKFLNLPSLKMPSSCKTRWWSETDQLKFTIANEMALYKFVTTYPNMDQSLLITNDDINRIKAILLVMEPMEKYVTTLGSETIVSASLIAPLILKLGSIFNKFEFSDAVASFEIRKFFRGIPTFFHKLYIEEKSHLEISTYLDP